MATNGNGQQALWFLNTRVNIVIPSAAGKDRMSVLRHRAPFGDSPPLHIHETEDEIFHVLEGTFRFRVGDTDHTISAGETLLAPKGIAHAYCVESKAGGSWLTFTTPGDFENLVREISRPAENDGLPPPVDHPSPEQIKALELACARNHIVMVGPPLTPRA
jgi:quercetin dioxygenase-like cupin family protein